jgi:hypothetical protein
LKILKQNKNEDLVSQLVLLSPAGLFTTLGKYGAYWAFFFSSLLPESAIIDYGTAGLYVLNTIMDTFKCDYEYYWNLQYWLSQDYIGHLILSKFTYYDLCKSCWKYPVSDKLLNLKIPVSIVYGKNDCIIPFKMGLAVHSCNPDIDLYLLHGVGHSLHKELDGEPFANVFVNKNWKNWINFLLYEKISFIFIGPKELQNNFFVQKYINIPLYLVNDWDSKGNEYLLNILNEVKKHKNKIFLFSGGPISKILISHSWNQHPYNIYLDVGSSLDTFMNGKTNRHYVGNDSPLSQLECKFDSNLIEI